MTPTTDVLFGQAYHLQFDPKLWAAMQPYPPLGSLYAAAAARKCGLTVAFADSMLADGVDDWCAAVLRARPRYAVLFEDNFNYLTKMCLTRMREAAVEMIAFARRHGARVVVCGSDATDHPEAYLEAGAEFVLRGEGDETLVELLEHMEHQRDPSEFPTAKCLDDILSLTWIDPRDGRRNTPTRAPIRNLDALPGPAWDLVDLQRYERIWRKHHGYFSLNLVTTRGCPYHCNWCAKPLWGQRYNMHSAAQVAAQVAAAKARCNPDHIWFMDDIMGLKRGWFRKFADELRATNQKIRFKCLSRADLLLRPGEIEAMADAGCDIVWIGAESGSQKILDAMDKGTKVEQIYEAAAKLKAAGIKVAFFLQFGYPGEGLEEIAATRKMVLDCAPDDIGISVSYPLPGTRFHEMVAAQLGDKQNWVDSSDLAMMFQGPFTTEFYRHLHTVIHREYRSLKTLQAQRESSAKIPDLRRFARLAIDQAALLADERKLLELAAVSQTGVGDLSSDMTHRQAATPSPQRHRGGAA